MVLTCSTHYWHLASKDKAGPAELRPQSRGRSVWQDFPRGERAARAATCWPGTDTSTEPANSLRGQKQQEGGLSGYIQVLTDLWGLYMEALS